MTARALAQSRIRKRMDSIVNDNPEHLPQLRGTAQPGDSLYQLAARSAEHGIAILGQRKAYQNQMAHRRQAQQRIGSAKDRCQSRGSIELFIATVYPPKQSGRYLLYGLAALRDWPQESNRLDCLNQAEYFILKRFQSANQRTP